MSRSPESGSRRFRTAGWAAALFLLAAAAVWAFPGAVKTNRGSIQFLAARSLKPSGAANAVHVPAGHPREWFWKALLLYDAGDFSGAVESVRGDLKNPAGLEAQLSASAFLAQGDYTAAIAIGRSRGSAEFLLATAELARNRGDRSGASAAYQAAYDLDPIKTTSLYANFLISEMEDPAAAENLLRNALELTSNNRFSPYWWLRLARLLEAQERWTEAAEAYQAVIEKHHLMYAEDQQLYRRYLDLAWVYHKAGMNPQALESLENSVVEFPQDATDFESFWLRAGQIYERAGQISEARDAYRLVLDRFPQNTVAREGLQRLSESGLGNGG